MQNQNPLPLDKKAKHRPRYHVFITWLLVVLSCFYVAFTVVRLQHHKLLLEDQAAQQLQNISLSMKRSLALQLTQLETVHKLVADHVVSHFPDQLSDASSEPAKALEQLLTKEAAGNDDIEIVGVADQSGYIRFMSTNVTSFKVGDQIDLTAFQVKSPPTGMITQLYVGGPRSTWPNGFLTIRPIVYPDGGIRAFVFALQSNDAFLRRIQEQRQAGFSLGKNPLIAISETASRRLAFRYPAELTKGLIGKPVPAVPAQPFRKGSKLNYMVSAYDQIKRLVIEVPLVNSTFTLRVGVAESDYLAPWYSEVFSAAAASLLLLLFMSMLLLMVRKSGWQAAELQHDNEQLAIGASALRKLIDTAPVALAQVRMQDGKILTSNTAFKHLFPPQAGRSISVIAAVFADPVVWENLSADLDLDGSLEGKQVECKLNIGPSPRQALVSAALLPSKRNASKELLLSFTDTEAQFAREQALADVAYTDALTQLPNRRAFFNSAENAFAAARRYQRPLAVLMLDLDHFKRVNDTYGHAAGDAVLVRTAECLRQSVREADLPARLGGEEFVVMLPETGLQQALELAERIRYVIEYITPVEYEGQLIQVTASIGVAMMDSSSNDVESMIKQADEALYQAKESGRNKVVCAEPRADV